jgi:putative transposase
MRHITKLKKLAKYAHWRLVNATSIQEIVFRIDRAYQLFFRNRKHGIKSSPPGFRKVKKYKSMTFKKKNGWKLLGGNKVRIQDKVYKFSKSREIVGRIKTMTVKRDKQGSLWLYFVVENDIEVPDRTGNSAVGFDFGLKTFLSASDGTTYESPQFLKASLSELRHAQRALSRKVERSKGWYKAKRNVARIHQRVVNQRRDWFFKLAHLLTDKYDLLFFEDLNMKGMVALWGRKVSDLARSEFMNILEWVAKKKGKVVGYVDRYFPSTKLCHVCGAVNDKLTLADRHWVCDCGAEHNRDLNASVNICAEGVRRCGLEDIRPVHYAGNLA